MVTVSIILPTFNRDELLRLAIESVNVQSFTDWNMVIADDGSQAQTRAYLRSLASPRIQVLELEHCGNPAKVRNAAISAATGQYLAFLDSDDMWAPDKLDRQLAAMQRHPHCRWSYTACNRIDHQGRPLVNERLASLAPQHGWIFEPLLRLQTAAAMPAVMAERAFVGEIGGFDEEQHFGEQQDFCLRMALRSEVCALPEALCSIRAHAEHYSDDRIAAHLSWMRLYEKMAPLAPTAALRAYCNRMRADKSLAAAAALSGADRPREALATLARALPFSWRYPHWWLGALKRALCGWLPGPRLRSTRDLPG